MSKYCWLVLVLVLFAAGCGNEKSTSNTPVMPTVDPNLPTITPRSTSAPLPPTWTPPPTVTQPAARPTLEITRDRPTATIVVLPSYTPTTEPPTPLPPGPTLTVTAEMINQALYTALSSGSGGLFEVPPTVTLQDGMLLIGFNLLNTPGNISTAIPVQIEASPYIIDGRIKVVKSQAYRTDTSASIENEVIDNVVTAVEAELTKLIEQLYLASEPPRENFFVSDLLVTNTGITVVTVTL